MPGLPLESSDVYPIVIGARFDVRVRSKADMHETYDRSLFRYFCGLTQDGLPVSSQLVVFDRPQPTVP
jgi:hypothetical protein